MGLLANIKNNLLGLKVKAEGTEQGNRLDQYVLSQLMGRAVYPDPNSPTYLKSYTGNGDVFTVINKITEPSSTVPIYQYDKNGEQVNGRMIQLLNNPNPYFSQSEFIEAALTFYLIFGNCYIAFQSIENGLNANKPLRLDILPPQWMDIVLGTYLDPVAGYKFTMTSNSIIDYPKERVMHWKEFNPDYDGETTGRLKGMSRLKPIIKSVTGSDSGYDALVSSFQHQGAVGLLTILGEDSKPRSMSKSFLSQIKSQWKAEYEGSSKSGSIVITDKDHKWTHFGLTPVELSVLNAIGTFKGAICDAYNVPTMLLSGSEDRTYNNYQEALRALWTGANKPSIDSLLQKLTSWLAPLFGEEGQVLQADYSGIDVLQKDTAQLVTWMTLAKSFTRNEIREACGYDRIEDPAMDVVFDSAGMVPVSELGMMPGQEMTEEVMKALRLPDYRIKN